jgi:DNA primase
MSECDPITEAHQRWGITLHHESGDEFSGPCPFCKGGDDRFNAWAEVGNYWCRQCGAKGWLDEERVKLSRDEIRLRKLEAEAAKARRERRQMKKRLSALEQMAQCRDHILYHKLMDADDRNYWHSQGMTDDTIDRYLLGVCWNCPTDKEHRPSYTIPIVNGGKLVNIRHRLIGADGDKYRPHLAGLGNTLFNADNLYKGFSTITVVEGEKKSIVLSQNGIETVGIMGKAGFPPAWATRFTEFERVNVCLDPDAEDKAVKLAALFGGRGHVVRLPAKPDDFFVEGGTVELMEEFMRLAWRVD